MKDVNTQNLVRRYESGESLGKLSKELHVDYKALARRLAEQGVNLRSQADAARLACTAVIPNIEELAARYAAGESLRSLTKAVGVKDCTLRARLVAHGVNIRGVSQANGRTVPGMAAIARRYAQGESVNRLALECGVSRTCLTNRLARRKVKLRSQSDAERLKWSRMTDRQRARQMRAAHLAMANFNEHALFAALVTSGFAVEQQFEIGPYHVDLGCTESSVAVEVDDGGCFDRGRRAQYLERAEQIFSQGWRILVIVTEGERLVFPDAAQKAIAFLKLPSGQESAVGEYGVVDRYGQPLAAARYDFDGRTRVSGF